MSSNSIEMPRSIRILRTAPPRSAKAQAGSWAGIADDDEMAAAQDHFVEAEIFEVPAVGEVDVGIGFVGEAEGFGEDRGER